MPDSPPQLYWHAPLCVTCHFQEGIPEMLRLCLPPSFLLVWRILWKLIPLINSSHFHLIIPFTFGLSATKLPHQTGFPVDAAVHVYATTLFSFHAFLFYGKCKCHFLLVEGLNRDGCLSFLLRLNLTLGIYRSNLLLRGSVRNLIACRSLW